MTDSMPKIRLKGGPKQFKSGRPGLSARPRLERSLNALLVRLARFARKEALTVDGRWATRVFADLQATMRRKPDEEP